MTNVKKVTDNYAIILVLPIDPLELKIVVADNIFIFRVNDFICGIYNL
jgi:hypothetical protein